MHRLDVGFDVAPDDVRLLLDEFLGGYRPRVLKDQTHFGHVGDDGEAALLGDKARGRIDDRGGYLAGQDCVHPVRAAPDLHDRHVLARREPDFAQREARD